MAHILYIDAQGQCWYKFSYKSESQIWEYATLLIPMAAAILYCTVVFATVAYTLYTASRAFDAHFGQSPVSLDDRPLEDPENQRKTTRDLRRVVGRILIYVLFPLATQLGFVVSEIWMYFNKRISYNLNLWSTPGLALAGLFNFIAFILDPAVNNAFRVIREYAESYFHLLLQTLLEYFDMLTDLNYEHSQRYYPVLP